MSSKKSRIRKKPDTNRPTEFSEKNNFEHLFGFNINDDDESDEEFIPNSSYTNTNTIKNPQNLNNDQSDLDLDSDHDLDNSSSESVLSSSDSDLENTENTDRIATRTRARYSLLDTQMEDLEALLNEDNDVMNNNLEKNGKNGEIDNEFANFVRLLRSDQQQNYFNSDDDSDDDYIPDLDDNDSDLDSDDDLSDDDDDIFLNINQQQVVNNSKIKGNKKVKKK